MSVQDHFNSIGLALNIFHARKDVGWFYVSQNDWASIFVKFENGKVEPMRYAWKHGDRIGGLYGVHGKITHIMVKP